MISPQSSVRIVTDSTAIWPETFVPRDPIEVVPQVIMFGRECFKEGVDLSYDEFLKRLRSSPQLPKTAAPLPEDLVEAYRRQLRAAQTILSIHPSLEVSGTVRSALTVKAEYFPDADIRIIDTRTIAGNLGSLVMVAAQMAGQGASADEIVASLNALIPRARMYFLVATLEYLQKGGRIGGAAALVGSVLQIKPILELKNGRVEAREKARGYRHAWTRLKELVVEECPRTPEARLCVMHAASQEAAARLAAELQAELQCGPIPVLSAGAAITTHGGPGALGVGFFV